MIWLIQDIPSLNTVSHTQRGVKKNELVNGSNNKMINSNHTFLDERETFFFFGITYAA